MKYCRGIGSHFCLMLSARHADLRPRARPSRLWRTASEVRACLAAFEFSRIAFSPPPPPPFSLSLYLYPYACVHGSYIVRRMSVLPETVWSSMQNCRMHACIYTCWMFALQSSERHCCAMGSCVGLSQCIRSGQRHSKVFLNNFQFDSKKRYGYRLYFIRHFSILLFLITASFANIGSRVLFRGPISRYRYRTSY